MLGMDTTQLLKGVLDVAVLAVVEDEDGYGYDVVRRLRAGGLEEVGDASVYGTLRRLYSAGALTSYVVPSEEGPHRKYYGITPPAGPSVQLFDQKGRPVAVSAASSMGVGADRQVTCPWFNGTMPLFNVFPLPQRAQRYGTCLGKIDPAKVGVHCFDEPPLASVPPATLPAGPQG